MTKEQAEKLERVRWRCRTDLEYLAKEVLGYKDIEHEVHYPLFNILQHFEAPPLHLRHQYDIVTTTRCGYVKPWVPMEKLQGGRRRLILDPRGFYKTTINVVCHTVQWILNYPDIAILIVHARQETAEEMLSEIRSHFLYNDIMRDLFPEFCLSPKTPGSRGKFTVPNRRLRNRKESTVGVCSLDSSVAGMHFDVIKFTDVVDPTNTGTAEQCKKTVQSFGMFRNILKAPSYWIDVEGTCYHIADLYSEIIEGENKLPPEKRQWSIHVRGVFKKNTKGSPYAFIPEERELVDLVDEKGSKISWFPAKFPIYELENMRDDPALGKFLFSAQQLNNPIEPGDHIAFPLSQFRSKTTQEIRKVPILYYTTSVDTAETVKRGSDYSVVLTMGWDQNGRGYVVDVRHGKYLPDALINEIFDVYRKWRSRSIRVEETGYVRGLKTSIRRYEDLTGVYLPFIYLQADNQRSKEERILLTLQPWYKRGEIFFDESIPCLEHFKKELASFPKGRTDDLIDALADQFQDKAWLGRETERGAATGEQFQASWQLSESQYADKLKKLMAKAQERKINGEGEYRLGFTGNERQSSFWDTTGGL